ncbi:MAG: ATP-binding cassette domain-containing protein, partial [Propionibacteriaceae bacterium]|nr:ATP-binding cassette domain-containing protein [Propionibacteriaceae bacterium]
MIDIEEVSFRYAQGAGEAGLERITLRVGAGEVVVLTGGSGCGKTTLTRLVNGLIPHYHPGELTGSARVAGIEVARAPLHRTAAVVGSVFQNPRSQFFTTDVASELAFGAENLGHPVPSILTAIEHTAAELGLAELLPRSIFELSGGEKQKVACGSVWVTRPRVLVLDEPSSNLDAATIGDLAGLVARWKAEGCAVLVAEHRLAWLQGLADRWLLMEEGRIVEELDAATMATMDAAAAAARGLRSPQPVPVEAGPAPSADSERIELVGFSRSFAGRERPAVAVASLALPRRGVIAVTGSNGAGKSTLIRALVGLDR